MYYGDVHSESNRNVKRNHVVNLKAKVQDKVSSANVLAGFGSG